MKQSHFLTMAGEEAGHQTEAHINYLDKSNSSPLHLAVRGGNIEAIRLCITTGARVDQQQVRPSHEDRKKNGKCKWLAHLVVPPQHFPTNHCQKKPRSSTWMLQILNMAAHPLYQICIVLF